MENRFTIVASNIKTGGGKELLDYLVEYLEVNYKNLKLRIYLDVSMQHIKETQQREVVYLKTNLSKMLVFAKRIDNALYFGNLPPFRKSENSIVYFHNPYLLMSIKKLFSSSLNFFIKYALQQLYITFFMKNVKLVACQNKLIKNNFLKKYNHIDMEILPFFRLCKKNIQPSLRKYDFCYVSLAHPHKNHTILFQAMKILSKNNMKIKLVVTIENDKKELLNEIEKINALGVVEILNKGVLSKDEVCSLYSETKCLIFPSKEETFGLALIEAVDMGLDVISADLEYVYQIITPSLVFDPNSAKMCADVIMEYMEKDNNTKSISLIQNNIDKLINKFISKD